MSRKAPAKVRKIDRRVRRTQNALGDALVDLMHEKPFEEITVQHVLDRAGVGRSTFYSHFSDKNDLFLSDAEEFFESMAAHLSQCGEASDRVAPVREMFAHAAGMGRFLTALTAAGKIHDVMELAQGHFARGIEQRFAEVPRGRGIPPDKRTAAARALAGALLSLLTWWIDRGSPESPDEMDNFYHRMVWAGVSASPVQPGKRS